MIKLLKKLNYQSLGTTFTMTLSLSSMAFSSTTHPSCDAFKNLVTQSIETAPPSMSTAQQLAQIIPPETRVVFIGEEHGDWPAITHEAEIITALHEADKDFNCLFIEKEEGFGIFSNLTAHLDGPYGFNQTQQDLNKMGWKALTGAWLPAAYAAKKAKMKVFEFDAEGSDRILGVKTRNAAMANHLVNAVSKRECKKAITLNGFWHTLVETKSGYLVSLPNQVKKKGLSPYTVLLRSRGLEKDFPIVSSHACDYTAIGGNQSYVLSGQHNITGLFQEYLDGKFRDNFIDTKLMDYSEFLEESKTTHIDVKEIREVVDKETGMKTQRVEYYEEQFLPVNLFDGSRAVVIYGGITPGPVNP